MKKPRKRDNEVSYWESMADGVIGLLLCILLILMLLILYLMRAKDDDFIGDSNQHGEENGGHGYTYDWEHADTGDDGDDEHDEKYENSGGGGGGGYLMRILIREKERGMEAIKPRYWYRSSTERRSERSNSKA